MVKHIQHIALILTLLLLVGISNEAWATKVTYHILTKPINNDIYHMKSEVSGWRLEAIKVVMDKATDVGLLAHYKSPLATNFRYYSSEDIINGGSATALYDINSSTKGVRYKVKGIDTADPSPTPVAEGTPVSGNTVEFYVIYDYNEDNTIAKLDGSVSYNIKIKNKGFLAYNRGRNNRPAVVPNNVTPEMLASEDFVKIENPGGNIVTYWIDNTNNKNKQAEVEKQFHFIFKFEGNDPYNIIIRTAYNRDISYIEKNDDTKEFVYKWYKGGSLLSVKTANSYIASDDHKKYNISYNTSLYPTNPTDLREGDGLGYILRSGQFHGQSGTIWGSVALLNNSNSSGYVFMGTRTVDDNGNTPTSQYYLKFDNNNLVFSSQTLDAVSNNYSTEGIYPIKKVTFKVPTPFYSVEATENHIVSASNWISQYAVDNKIENKYIPTELKRKYCDFNGVFYKDAARTQKIEKFSEANYNESEGYQIYLGYELAGSLPFKAITPVASYSVDTWKTATWYELTDEDETTNKKIRYNGTNFQNNGVTTTYEKASEYAFIGDPYELQVILRSATSGATPSYVGATGSPTTGTAFTPNTTATAGYKWEIPTDATDNSFLLKLYKGAGNWYWDTEATDQNVTFSTTSSTRVRVLELPMKTFTYKIVDRSGRIAVTASASQPIFSSLSLASIPSIIVSPFILDETITFYSSYSGGGRGNLSGVITDTPDTDASIYVKYTTTNLNSKPFKLSEDQEIFVRLNGQYIYYDDGTLKSTETSTDNDNYKWKLRNRDPYAMLIDNLGARTALGATGVESVTLPTDDDGTTASEERQKGAWVDVESIEDAGALSFTIIRADAQRFIAKSSTRAGVYEVMVATGDDVDASTAYYNIGRPDKTTVKIYSNATYQARDDAEIKFQLEENINYTYHLIDKAKHELLTVLSKSPELVLPAEYQSPLVGAANYSYYSLDQLTIDDSKNPKEYSPTNPAVKLTTITDLNALFPGGLEASSSSDYENATDGFKHEIGAEGDIEDAANKLTTLGYHYYNVNNGTSYKKVNITKAYQGTDIYVTYKMNDLVKFNDDASPYLLKFLNPFAEGYFLEDGNDKLTTEKIQAVYPYTNGDGSLNIYGQAMNEEQMGGGAATRPRWIWFFDSDHDDPYHVKIHSKSTISHNSVSHPTYLQTYAVHFKQDANAKQQHIVTGGILPGIASVLPTEYMILGVEGRFKLLTTNPVEADLNGDGDTGDANENDRQYVTSLEQYWKTYNMAKLHVLGISKTTDAFSNDESTWGVPTDPTSYRETLVARDWHSYDVVANATRWNGYNDKSDGHEKKVVENLEHWFQTFDMGDGTFDIENANIPPVLVLLDRHGWEIMRRPLPTAAYPLGDELEALRVFDSPMVDKYYFYSNATKASGCHKYTLRMQNGAERDQIKVNGEHYTSTSLGDLPPKTATGVVSGGAIQDFYVTYTVKDEYEKSFKYELDYDEIKDANDKVTGYTINSETGTPSKFVIVQHGRYARKEINSDTNYLSKPVTQATKPTGGNVYDMILSPSNVSVGNIIVDTNGDGIIDNDNLWYVEPNLNIDNEMGIKWGTAISGAEPLSEVATKVTYKDKTGFDPYNLQIRNASTGKFYTMDLSSTTLSNGVWEGTLTSDGITLQSSTTSGYVTPEGYDHTTLQITKQTFMAVSDANGNMQLMPRFDHTKRVNVDNKSPYHTTLKASEDHDEAVVTDNASMGPQTVFMVLPQKFEYHIIDHDGNEALRYKTAGEYSPSIPNRYRSPLATDFKYYYGSTEKEISEAGDYASQWANADETYKRTALTDALVTSQADYLPATGDYYFRIGTDPGSYTYKKVSVTKVKEIDKMFADAGLDRDVNQVYVRYRYWEEADNDKYNVLQGKWFTINLANKNVQSTETTINADGNNVFLYADEETPTKIAPIDGTDAKRKWQWKFLASPTDISSPYYRPIDPYAIQIFNRKANYTTDMSVNPSPMSIGVKVDGKDRFVLLSHPNEGYALAVAGLGLENYSYSYLNGAKMTAPSTTAASIVEECFQKSINAADIETLRTTLAAGPDAVYYVKLNGTETTDKPTYEKVTVTSSAIAEEVACTADEWEKSYISIGAQLILNDDVTHTYTYNVITNDDKFAVSDTQTNNEAAGASYAPVLPNSIQSPLLNMDDYKYYGSVNSGTYIVDDETKLVTLHGLYDDVVYVRYESYDMDKTEFKVPNKRNDTGGSTISVDADSKTASLNISGGLPYNIIWEDDKMMTTNGSTISNGGSHKLDGTTDYVWRLFGDDPYAIQIRHGSTGKYVDGTGTLNENPKNFMLLKNADYAYGILQETGGTNKLTDYGETLTTDPPKYFIIFGLSVHDLIYHLVLARTCTESEKASPATDQYVDIPYSDKNTPLDSDYNPSTGYLRVYGSTQRDLETIKDDSDPNKVAGDKYQLGETISWGGANHTYSYHAGQVSIGGDLQIPNEFYRPNCTFEYYVAGIYDGATSTIPNDELEGEYKGLKLGNDSNGKLMSDADLIDQTVVVNIVYKFNQELATNSGLDFVKSKDQNLWYTFETYDGSKPYLAHYTNAWGLQSMEGRETRYTNDYLWTPLGDPYGFIMYNRYMIKNSGADNKVMTTSNPTFTDVNVEGTKLKMAVPGEEGVPVGNEVYELLAGDADGYFRIHPVINTKDQTQYYVRRYNDKSNPDFDHDGQSDLDYTILSTTPCDWTFGLDMTLLEPYYTQAGYIGGLTTTAKDPTNEPKSGKELYEDALNVNIMEVQKVVYNDNNIVDFAPGYYRLHSMPGTPGLSTIRYASGYLHKTELTGDGSNTSGPIPMHFYSKKGSSTTFGSSGLKKGYTKMDATQGDIPVPATEYDPSTIFYLSGGVNSSDQDDRVNPRVKMSTQGLYVKGIATDSDHGDAVMTATPGDATTFSLIGIGGAVFLITDKLDPPTRSYLHYSQDYEVGGDNKIYDLKFFHNSPTNEARWCIEPANNQGLTLTTNNGGDGYFYTTFYAPYDVLLPNDNGNKKYYAYIGTSWSYTNAKTEKVTKAGYTDGKFIPAGTPAIIRTTDESLSIKLTLPSSAPSSKLSCVFSGECLEQLLAVDAAHDVYTLGVPFVSDVEKDNDYNNTGVIHAPVPEQAKSGIGFYINATPNKEAEELQSLWERNNRYVIHNKIYYRATGGGNARENTRGIEFVPVVFDDEEGEEDENGVKEMPVGDGCVYDLLGRKVATKQQVEEGTWKQNLRPGIYILNGRKIRK